MNKLLLPASGEILVDGESIEKKRNYCGYMAAAGSFISLEDREGESPAADGDPGQDIRKRR